MWRSHVTSLHFKSYWLYPKSKACNLTIKQSILTSFILFLPQFFERCSKFVEERKWKLWQNVTQEFMSDEKDQGKL